MSVSELDSDRYLSFLEDVKSWFLIEYEFAHKAIEKISTDNFNANFYISEIIKKIAKIDDEITKNLRKRILLDFSINKSIRLRQASVQGFFYLADHHDLAQLNAHMKYEKNKALLHLYATLITWIKK